MTDKLISHLEKLVYTTQANKHIKNKFLERAKKGALTRDEDPLTHFCVYFAAFDPSNQQVFIGHHKKSGLWLFNGGHIDRGELPSEALEREIREEWGEHIKLDGEFTPSFLTITEIENPTKQTCKLHYDIWYFTPFDKESFVPEKKLLVKEFHQTGWQQMEEAKKLITDINTLTALNEIEKLF